jgi:peptidoglycan/LPS O-acetylase OafA/YrhL
MHENLTNRIWQRDCIGPSLSGFWQTNPSEKVQSEKIKTRAAVTYDQFRANKYFDSLTGLRAIAVTLVLITHFAGQQGAFLLGWLGVQIFFVLSGFLITTLLLREHDEKGEVSLPRFYIRRAFRIFPVYYLWLAILLWQAHKMGGARWEHLYDALPYYLTFNNEQFGDTSWRITWTLGIEWKFYLVWPALAFVLARGHKTRWLASIMAFGLLAKFWKTDIVGPFHYTVLLYGAVLAVLMHSRRGYRIVEPLTKPIACMVVFVLFAVLQYKIGAIRTILHNPEDAGFDNLYGLAVCLLIPAILGNGLPRRLLSSGPFVFVGQRSYSLYLIQISIAEAASGFAIWRTFDLEFTVIVLCLGLIVADVLYRYVEKPMICLGHKAEQSASHLFSRAMTRTIVIEE